MPNGNGVDLLNNIRALPEPRPQVILISGFSYLNEKDATDLGAYTLLQKPFRPAEIIRLVENLIVTKLHQSPQLVAYK